MNSMNHKSRSAVGIALLALCLFLAAGIAGAATPFAKENAPTFLKTVLTNGIPVYMKVQKANQVFHISLVLRGGSLVTPQERAGWEAVALKTMARSSQAFPYEKAAALLDRTSSSISAETQFEYSSFSLTTLDKYIETLLPLWGDMLTAPSFDEHDFEQVKEEALLAIQSKEQSPWSTTQKLINEEFFRGHPYSVTPEGTEKTLEPMAPADARDWYRRAFSADRIFVVAVGSFDPVALARSLESLLSSIPNLGLGPVPQPPAFSRMSGGKILTRPHDQSKGTIYLRGDFPAPVPDSEDFFPAALAARMFSDLLFSVVRDKYGAVYTPSAQIRNFTANYGSLIIYKTSQPESIKRYIDEAARAFAQGRVVSVDPARTGPDGFMPLEDALEVYRQIYMNEYFEAAQNNAAIAGLMIRSVIRTGDPAAWLRDQERIESVSAAQVRRAFDTWMKQGAFLWMAVGDRQLLDRLPLGDFEAFRF